MSNPIIVDPLVDNDFSSAWEEINGVNTVNLEKAKLITKWRLRLERKPLMEVQDIRFLRALETNADTTGIVAEKQRLRDITLLADACTTLDELRALKTAA
jgi:hypothetical protein